MSSHRLAVEMGHEAPDMHDCARDPLARGGTQSTLDPKPRPQGEEGQVYVSTCRTWQFAVKTQVPRQSTCVPLAHHPLIRTGYPHLGNLGYQRPPLGAVTCTRSWTTMPDRANYCQVFPKPPASQRQSRRQSIASLQTTEYYPHVAVGGEACILVGNR